MSERYFYVKAKFIHEQEGVITAKLADGFGNAIVVLHKDSVSENIPSPAALADDLTRLPLLMAPEVSKALGRVGPTRADWLQMPIKQLLKFLRGVVDELDLSVGHRPDGVLRDAADVAALALMIADKADKLEQEEADGGAA